MLSLRGDVFINSATFFGACASGNAICTVTSEPKFRRYNYLTLGLAASATLSGSNPSDVSFIAPGSCVVSYNGSSEFDIVDINSMAVTRITTNAKVTTLTSSQQIAGNINLQLAMSTAQTTGSVSLVSLATATTLSPAGLSGAETICVCVRPDTNTWMIGTTTGKIIEINSVGTILNTVTLPTTPNVSSPTIKVYGISFSYPNVAAATDTGCVFVYNWVTQTFLYKFMSADGFPILCSASSGTTLLAKRENSGANGGCPISEIYFEQSYPLPECIFLNNTNTTINSLNLENSYNYAMCCFNASSFDQLRIYNMLPTDKVFVNTRMQNPPGTDITGRVIRIRDNGIGTACVEIDQTIVAGNNSVQCTDSRNYIELGIDSGVANFDIREMQG